MSFDPLTGREIKRHERATVYPKSHFVTPRPRRMQAIKAIRAELTERLAELERGGKVLEAQRLHQRTMFDLEMMKEIGYCHGIENYSRHLSGRAAGRAAADPARLPSRGRGHHRGREPPDRPAGAWDVHGGSLAQGSAGRVRVPPSVRARQPAVELRGVGGAGQAGPLRQRDARSVRAPAVGRSHRRAGHPPHGPRRSRHRGPTGHRSGGRSAGGDPRRGRPRRARAGDDADEADGGGPEPVLPGAWGARPLSALGHRHARTGPDPARPAARHVRRAGRHQPAPRRAGPAGSVARRDSGRGQGGLPAIGGRAHSDRRPRGTQRARPRAALRGPRHRLDAPGHSRDRAAPGRAGGVQRRARHHPGHDRQEHRGRAVERVRARLRHRAESRGRARCVPQPGRSRRLHRPPRAGDAGSGGQPRVRARGRSPRSPSPPPEPRSDGPRAGDA